VDVSNNRGFAGHVLSSGDRGLDNGIARETGAGTQCVYRFRPIERDDDSGLVRLHHRKRTGFVVQNSLVRARQKQNPFGLIMSFVQA